MKITCQSCQARYTIADEKVRGKIVKIRCKKCSATIVVDGNQVHAAVPTEPEDAPTRVLDAPSGGAPSDPPWSVSVADGDERTLTTAALVELYARGEVFDDTYVWRDGMEDWKALAEVEELRPALGRFVRETMVADAVLPPAPEPTPAPAPAAGLFAASPAGALATPVPRASDAAARRKSSRGGTDLFAASSGSEASNPGTPPPSERSSDRKMSGERSENSVLFSLSALTASAQPSSKKDEPREPMSSGMLDIHDLSTAMPAPKAPDRGLDDIINLGGGGIFSQSLAAPVLAPPSADAIAAVSAAPSQSGAAQPKSRTGLVLGAVAILAVAGVAGAYLLGQGTSGAPAPVASAVPPESASAAPTDTATAAAGTAAATAAASAAAAVAPQPTAIVPGALPPTPAKADKPAGAAPVAAKSEPRAAEPKAPVAKAEPKAAEPKAPATAAAEPAADGPAFDRAAALTALGNAASAAQSCKKPDGPTGSGRVAVTFATTGMVTTANVEGPPFAGTPVGGCVAARFRSAHVPAFSGGTVTVHKSFTIN